MKIVIDGRLYGLENAGLGRYVINLVSNLSTIDTQNEYSILLRKKYYDSLRLKKNWTKILADFGHYSVKEQLRLKKILEKENPDIVHFPHFNVPVFFKGKFVVTIHDLLMHRQTGPESTTLIPPLYFLKRLGYKTVFRRAVVGASKIIVPSKAVKDEVEKYYKLSPDKISVIYEGFDEKISGGDFNRLANIYKITKPYFIYTGNAYPHKNLKRLIEATILLNKVTEKEISLVIVSSRNIFIKRLEKTVKDLGAAKFVKLLGFVPDGDLGALYKNSVACICPSLSEGFGLPGLEAMNSGTLVLASNIPVYNEIYGKNALYFNPLDFSSIEKSMKEVLQIEATERSTRISEAREFAKNYSWDKMAAETLKIYEEESKKSRNSLRSGK